MRPTETFAFLLQFLFTALSSQDINSIQNLTHGLSIYSSSPQAYTGQSVSSAGDFNHDGINDIIVSAYNQNALGRDKAGVVFVIYGQKNRSIFPVNIDMNTALDLSVGVAMYGAVAEDSFGRIVSSAGDFNADGIDDIVVAACNSDPLGRNAAGTVYVIYGKKGGFSAHIDLNSTLDPSAGFKIYGATAGDSIGTSINFAGDVNNDDISDIIIGTYAYSPTGRTSAGATYVIYGQKGGPTADIDLLSLNISKGFRITGAATNDNSGKYVSAAGDFNNDGIDDFLTGAIFGVPNGRSQAGILYVFYGKTGGYSAHIDLATDFTSSMGFMIYGGSQTGWLGSAHAPIGDFNGDGISDIVLAAYNSAYNGINGVGQVYVLYGKTGGYQATLDLISGLDSSQGFTISGTVNNERCGVFLSSAGDFNKDGLDDIIFTCINGGPASGGIVHLVYGQKGGISSTIDLSAGLTAKQGFSVYHNTSGSQLGRSLSIAGDFDNDGAIDILLGAPKADPYGYQDAGTTYVIFSGISSSNKIL